MVAFLLTPAEPERQEETAREQVNGRRRTFHWHAFGMTRRARVARRARYARL